MAKTAAERRAARKRKEQSRSRMRAEQSDPRLSGAAAGSRPDQRWFDQERDLLVREFLTSAVRAGDEELGVVAAQLMVLDPEVDSARHATDLLLSLLTGLWEHGWQPADVAHVVRREGGARLARLAGAAIARQARVAGWAEHAPEEWLAQLAVLDAPADPPAAVVSAWRSAEQLPTAEAWAEVLQLLHLLGRRGELPRMCPPPSQWRFGGRRATAGGHHADTRVLGKIRALLAKAESTEFPEEAEALSAKAQELMTRYAVDEAVLDAERGDSLAEQVQGRRVHLENPYPEAKVRLLDAVGSANGVRVIYLENLGIATMVGLPVDLDLVDLLFTSLLVQATRAMAATGRAGGRGARTPSFRRTFLISYADRIRERLTEARDQVTEEAAAVRGTALVPVLQARNEAVGEVFERLFPQTYAIRSRVTNAQGWYAGRLAADHADLGSGREQVRG